MADEPKKPSKPGYKENQYQNIFVLGSAKNELKWQWKKKFKVEHRFDQCCNNIGGCSICVQVIQEITCKREHIMQDIIFTVLNFIKYAYNTTG